MATEDVSGKTSQDDGLQPDHNKSNDPSLDNFADPLNDDFLSEVRKGMEDSQPKNAPFTQTGQLGEFLKRVTNRLKPANQPASKSLEAPPDDVSVQIFKNQPDPPETRKLFPFDNNVPFPGMSQPTTPNNAQPRSLKNSDSKSTGTFDRGITGSLSLANMKTPSPTNSLKNLAQNLETKPGSSSDPGMNTLGRKQLIENLNQIKQIDNQTDIQNPFVNEDDENFQSSYESLASKIKNGSVPAETLRLLITSSTTQAEVLAICSELNIDWESIPGESRDEKTQYLIEYFHNRESHLDFKEVANNLRKQLSTQEEGWSESDTRLKELQENLTSGEVDNALAPEIVAEEKDLTFWEQLKRDFEQASKLQKALLVSLSLFVIGLLAVVIVFLAFPTKASLMPDPLPTPILLDIPSPKILELPGGWIFNLNNGVVQEGSWKPVGAEWLVGTDICRIISLPWNRQLEAVYGTFQPGDEFLLTMSNTDLLRYKVKEIKTLNLSDFNSDELDQMVTGTSPCLMVLLTQDQVETRQMLVAEPASLAPWESVVTVTPAVPVLTLPVNVQPSPTLLPTKKP